jgi:hypothetical protein
MGSEMPWYSTQGSLEALLVGRRVGRMHIVCYLRQASKVFETYWTTARGVEVMDNSYQLFDLTIYGRQETWEDSPGRVAQHCTYTRTSSGSPLGMMSGTSLNVNIIIAVIMNLPRLPDPSIA